MTTDGLQESKKPAGKVVNEPQLTQAAKKVLPRLTSINDISLIPAEFQVSLKAVPFAVFNAGKVPDMLGQSCQVLAKLVTFSVLINGNAPVKLEHWLHVAVRFSALEVSRPSNTPEKVPARSVQPLHAAKKFVTPLVFEGIVNEVILLAFHA